MTNFVDVDFMLTAFGLMLGIGLLILLFKYEDEVRRERLRAKRKYVKEREKAYEDGYKAGCGLW